MDTITNRVCNQAIINKITPVYIPFIIQIFKETLVLIKQVC